MSTVKEIESAIGQLPRDELFYLITWIRGRFADEWDRQIEDDVKEGGLDYLVRDALVEFHTGQTQPFPPDEKPCDS